MTREVQMTTIALPLDFTRLEQLYAAGLQDNFVDAALRKIVARQVERDESDLIRLNGWLAEFESKFEMKSEDFWQRFKSGVAEDTADFMEWNALYRSKVRLLARLKILRGDNGNA